MCAVTFYKPSKKTLIGMMLAPAPLANAVFFKHDSEHDSVIRAIPGVAGGVRLYSINGQRVSSPNQAHTVLRNAPKGTVRMCISPAPLFDAQGNGRP